MQKAGNTRQFFRLGYYIIKGGSCQNKLIFYIYYQFIIKMRGTIIAFLWFYYHFFWYLLWQSKKYPWSWKDMVLVLVMSKIMTWKFSFFGLAMFLFKIFLQLMEKCYEDHRFIPTKNYINQSVQPIVISLLCLQSQSRQIYKISQHSFMFGTKQATKALKKLIDFMFNNQNDFAEQKWMDSTTSLFLDIFASRVSNLTNVSEVQLRQQLQSGSESFYLVRSHWKYSVSNAIPGAPFFKMNGVLIDETDDFAANDWIKLIQTYRYSANRQKPQKKVKRRNFIARQ